MVSAYIVFDGMVEKPWFSAFQNFKWIENPLNIKEVMSQNVMGMLTLLIQVESPNSPQMLCVLQCKVIELHETLIKSLLQ